MKFHSQEYWSGLPLHSPSDLPNPGIEPMSPPLAGRFFTTEPLENPQMPIYLLLTKGDDTFKAKVLKKKKKKTLQM